MNFCKNCGNQMSDDIMFCPACGTSSTATVASSQQSFGQTNVPPPPPPDTPPVDQQPIPPLPPLPPPYTPQQSPPPPLPAPPPTPTPAPAPAPAPAPQYTQPQAQQQPQTYTQPQAQVAPTVYKEEPISTGGYFGILFLLAIPLINFLFLIIWACGGCNKLNKRNLSRAILLWMLISTILSALIITTGGLLFGDYINEIKELFIQMGESGFNQ